MSKIPNPSPPPFPPLSEGKIKKGGVNQAPINPKPPGPPSGQTPRFQEMPSQNEINDLAMSQVLAINKANLEAAPIFARFCGLLMKELETDFSRSEAMEIIKASVKK